MNVSRVPQASVYWLYCCFVIAFGKFKLYKGLLYPIDSKCAEGSLKHRLIRSDCWHVAPDIRFSGDMLCIQTLTLCVGISREMFCVWFDLSERLNCH